MDWDLWIGPAPYRPFHTAYHPVQWRGWWDFGSGTVADMACHSFHVFFKPLRFTERAPRTIYGYRSYRRPEDTREDRHAGLEVIPTPECESHANMVTWEFPGIGDLPPINVHWYDGGMRPIRPAELDKRISMPASGILFVGDKGKMLSGGGSQDLLLPAKDFRNFQRPPKTLPRSIGHYREWTQGCKTGKPTNCPMAFGAQMTEMALLGTIAIRVIPKKVGNGWPVKVLEWDAEAMRITNDEEANSYVNPPYRSGWSL